MNFLVDTGAALSIIPQNKTELSRETSPITLQAANKTKIATFGRKNLTLDLRVQEAIPLVFHGSRLRSGNTGDGLSREIRISS
ncbi:unnamed protein product [Schistosoma mattheei]|uniref:Uncharacterized protein n=1 Tax=Schistosoma mattheei TaxID=31246 RepID=A0A183Q2B9_9TREM|nr:unnamed protein product [Schistosoma mattheei]